MAGNIGSFNRDARFSAMNRTSSGLTGSGFNNIAGGNFSGIPPAGFGGVGSFNSNSGFGGFNSGFGGGGFNSFANPYAFGGNIGGFGGGAGAWGQFAFLVGAMLPSIIQGIQSLFEARRENAGDDNCGECSGEDHHNNSGHPDMSVHGSYIDGQDGHRINESGVNMSFEMDY